MMVSGKYFKLFLSIIAFVLFVPQLSFSSFLNQKNKNKINENVKSAAARDIVHMIEKLINAIGGIAQANKQENYKIEISGFIEKVMSDIAESNLTDEQAIINFVFPQLLILIQKIEKYYSVPFSRQEHNVDFASLEITNKLIQGYVYACLSDCEEYFNKFIQTQFAFAEQIEYVKAASICVDLIMTLAANIKSSLNARMMSSGISHKIYEKIVGSDKIQAKNALLMQEMMGLLEEVTMTMHSILNDIETFNFEVNDFSKFLEQVTKTCLLCLGTISLLLKNKFSFVPKDRNDIFNEAKNIFNEFAGNVITNKAGMQDKFFLTLVQKKKYKDIRIAINIAENLSKQNMQYDKPLYTKLYKKIYSEYTGYFGENGEKSMLSSIGLSGFINAALWYVFYSILHHHNHDPKIRAAVEAIRMKKDKSADKPKGTLEGWAVSDKTLEDAEKNDSFMYKYYAMWNKWVKGSSDGNNSVTGVASQTGEFVYSIFNSMTQLLSAGQSGQLPVIQDYMKNLSIGSTFAFNNPRVTEGIVATCLVGVVNFGFGKIDETIKISERIAKMFASMNRFLLNDSGSGDERGMMSGEEKKFSSVNLESPAFADLRATGELDWFFRVLKRIKEPYSDTDKDFSRSTLVIGPSGCGKTFLVNSFAQSVLEVKGMKVKVHEVQPHWFFSRKENAKGETQGNLFDTINSYIESLKMQEKAIIILYIDEFHLFFSGENGSEVDSARVAEFLTAFANIRKKQTEANGLYIICSTNKPEFLPHEFLDNPDRIGSIITISYPSHTSRIDLMKYFLKEHSIQGKNIDFNYLSTILEGNNVSQGWIMEAMMRALYNAKSAHQSLSTEHIYAGINSCIRKVVFSNKALVGSLLDGSAAYQAAASAIALILDYLNTNVKFDAVTVYPILPRIEPKSMDKIHERPIKRTFYHGDVFTMNAMNSAELFSYSETMSKIAIALAGREYGSFNSDIPISRSSTLRDKERAIDLALGYLTGFNNTICSEKLNLVGQGFKEDGEKMLSKAQAILHDIFKNKNFQKLQHIIEEQLKKTYFVNKKTLLKDNPEVIECLEAIAKECRGAINALIKKELQAAVATVDNNVVSVVASTKKNIIAKKKNK